MYYFLLCSFCSILLWIQRYLYFHTNFRFFFLFHFFLFFSINFYEKYQKRFLTEIALNLQITSGSIHITIMLVILIHGHKYLFISLCLAQFHCSIIYSFHCRNSTLIWLKTFLVFLSKIFFCKGITSLVTFSEFSLLS